MTKAIELGEGFWRAHLEREMDEIQRVLLRAEWEDLLAQVYRAGYDDGEAYDD